MEQRNKPEMDVEAMLLEQALRERVDAAFERLRNGTAVYLSHSEVETNGFIQSDNLGAPIGEGRVGGDRLRVRLSVYIVKTKCYVVNRFGR